MKRIKNVIGLMVLVALLCSCGSKRTHPSLKTSEKTGWSYNDPKKGFYKVKTQYAGMVPPGTVYISTMSFVKGQNENPVSSPTNDLKRRIGTDGFFLDEFEVTNINWREYVAWLQGVFRHNPRHVLLAMPDETVWRDELEYNEPYVNDYFKHVAFGFYPVVGVSWNQAMAYCQWRTDRVNERILIDKKIIDYTDLETINANIEGVDTAEYSKYIFTTQKKYEYLRELQGEDMDIDLDGIIFDAAFRLPTEAEWEYAAYGLIPVKDNFEEGRTYPWSGSQVREIYNKKTRGQFIANFVRGRGDAIGKKLNSTPTLPVGFFPPNEYGLYNMAGNVNEWVLDVYRATSNQLVGEFNSYRGNIYLTDSAYAESILDRLPAMEKDMRDSMRNVLINERKFYVPGGDVRDFKDGDRPSVIGDSILQWSNATPIEQATMISNTARVYKGGGWRDRAIWLNPAKRRWLDQDGRANDIGFRCAMSAVGGNNKKQQ
jgi:gliding motility-associated lipoprotein GldJ